MTVVLLDNHDALTGKLAPWVRELGAEVDVIANDATTPTAIAARRYRAVGGRPGPDRGDVLDLAATARRDA